MKEFLTISELSEYLNLKRSNLYSMVESGELPHYRFGKLIRFKKQDIDTWAQKHRRKENIADKKAKVILKAINRPFAGIDRIVKKTIEKEKDKVYTPNQEKPGGIEGLGKEVEDGII